MNNVLQRFHRYALSRIVWPLSLLVGVAMALGWQLAPDSVWSRLLAPLTSAAFVAAAFLFVEKKIRLQLWKVVYPELDFEGTWEGGTQYARQQVLAQSPEVPFKSFRKDHQIRFRQDCLNVWVAYDETEHYQGWNSTVATLVNDGQRVGLRYAYEVRYKEGEGHDERLPSHSRGLEEVFVVESKESGRPSRVTGGFAHAVDGPRPLYSGTVAFDRLEDEKRETGKSRLVRWIVTKWLKPPAE